jgi:hypothetical protein
MAGRKAKGASGYGSSSVWTAVYIAVSPSCKMPLLATWQTEKFDPPPNAIPWPSGFIVGYPVRYADLKLPANAVLFEMTNRGGASSCPLTR